MQHFERPFSGPKWQTYRRRLAVVDGNPEYREERRHLICLKDNVGQRQLVAGRLRLRRKINCILSKVDCVYLCQVKSKYLDFGIRVSWTQSPVLQKCVISV